jgi:4'-phosphopantetheinyl transferase
MSLLRLGTYDHFRIGIWKIEEEERELSRLYGYMVTEQFTNPTRRKQYLAVRLLARAMDINPMDIAYRESGKPYLLHGTKHISISHTINYVALLISDLPLIGIDIEEPSPRVLKIKHRFLHQDELYRIETCQHDETLAVLTHWCIKEAVFKAVPDEHIEFKEEIRVVNFPEVLQDKTRSFSSDVIEVLFKRNNQHFKCFYQIEDNLITTVCLSGTF